MNVKAMLLSGFLAASGCAGQEKKAGGEVDNPFAEAHVEGAHDLAYDGIQALSGKDYTAAKELCDAVVMQLSDVHGKAVQPFDNVNDNKYVKMVHATAVGCAQEAEAGLAGPSQP